MDRQTRSRVENALWGLFIGDALAMPVHWYYDRENIRRDFDGGVTGYEAPRHPHPESFMVGMEYRPDVESARASGRPYDILHDHVRFYDTSYSNLQIDRGDRESQHGNSVPTMNERFHYHHGLAKGENTLGAHLVRVLLRSIASAGEYHPDAFLEAFIHHLATPGLNNDPYTEIYIRHWFENYSRGQPVHACAETQRDVWSIGSHGGMIRPMVLSLFFPDSAYQAAGMALEHQTLTHRSENVAAALSVAIPLLHNLAAGAEPRSTLEAHAREVHLPVVTGDGLFAAYRDHHGPGNIPAEQMWKLHTDLRPEAFDLRETVNTVPEEEAVMGIFATACYPEHGFPLSLYLAARHESAVRPTLLANANAGGDSVHRGMVLGLLVGAAQDEIASELKSGLKARDQIQDEIDAALSTLA